MDLQDLNGYISLLWPYMKNYGVNSGGVDIDVSVLKDLGLDYILIKVLGGGSNADINNNLRKYITSKPDVISYRLDVIDDLIAFPEILKCFEEILPYIRDLRESIDGTGRISVMDKHLTDVLSRMSELQLYVECINRLNSAMHGREGCFKSEGLKRLYKRVSDIANSGSFRSLAEELPKMRNESSKLASVTVGINLDEQLKPIEAVLVSVNNEKYSSGSLMDRLTNLEFKANKFTGISPLQIIDNASAPGTGRNLIFRQAIINCLDSTLRSIVKPIIPIIEKYEEVNAGFLAALENDIVYLIEAVGFITRLKAQGFPMCRPQVALKERRICVIRDTYNMKLANKTGNAADIVLNDVQFDDEARIYILTGPNRGGKTTFIQAVGQAQLMFQLGLYVPGTQAVMSPVDGIYTHFPVEESETEGMGRMGEECKRLAEIFKKADQYSLVLMNESFSSTSPGEGMYIARDVMLGFRMIGVRAIYATHFHDLAADLNEMNAQIDGPSVIDSLVTGVKVKTSEKEDGELTERIYKVRRMPPQGKSFAAEIADFYGISIGKITQILKERGIISNG